MKQLTEDNLKVIINKQFEISWHDATYDDVKWEKWKDIWWQEWHQYYTATEAEWDEFREWLTKYIKDTCKVNKQIAEKETSWIYLDWGLALK